MYRFQLRVLAMTVTALLFGGALPGCIVGDIRDQMVAANENMLKTHELIEDANTRLDSIEQELEEVRRANDNLEEVRTLLAQLESINTSMGHLDSHLASLRNTIENIDSTIPFLSFSDKGDDEESEEDGESAPPDESGGEQ
jgi:prefoldin subunit 5